MKQITELVRGRPYGDNAQEIYLRCCDVFGWDPKKSEEFTRGHRLYAPECDFDDNGVWFVCYSNRSKTEVVADKHVHNFIENNGNRITEEIADTKNNNAKASDYKNRIVFIKNSDGQYFFAGVFELKQYEQLYRVHEIVSDRYPVEN